jgi:hypothetical protein
VCAGARRRARSPTCTLRASAACARARRCTSRWA